MLHAAPYDNENPGGLSSWFLFFSFSILRRRKQSSRLQERWLLHQSFPNALIGSLFIPGQGCLLFTTCIGNVGFSSTHPGEIGYIPETIPEYTVKQELFTGIEGPAVG